MILAVYVVLYNATTLQRTIGLIGLVMTCYGRKSKFADDPQIAFHGLGSRCASIDVCSIQ